MKLSCRTLTLATLLVAAVGCKKYGSSANSPLTPGSSPLPGIWVGTVTRPGGQAPLTLRWDTGLSSYTMSGPLTLTSGGNTATTTGQGNVAGNDKNGYSIHMSFSSTAAGCTVRGSRAGSGDGDPFPSPYKTITVPAFSISYVGCQTLINSANPFVEETVQLNLAKQE